MSTKTILARSIKVRGYAVLAGLGPPRQIGEIILGVSLGIPEQEFRHPFYVTEQTDKADWEEQMRMSNRSTYLNPKYTYFYRVTTD